MVCAARNRRCWIVHLSPEQARRNVVRGQYGAGIIDNRKIVPYREATKRADRGSKQSRVIALLQSPTGATIEAMMKATGWQPHSVRAFLAVVRKRLKLKLGSKKVDGNRVYQIASGDSRKPTSRQPQRRPA
jgi:hypothetical protein